ncbi:GNAT family N-acetyltransferase [Planomonospora sp. ID67723]|nr:GNAT family N-acetyltransferase [Planomonospora sp. ID67723]
MWTAQGLRAGVRAWASDGAVAVACPDLNRRDRLAVRGPAHQVAELVRQVRPELGPSYRLLGERPLVAEVVRRVPGAEVVGTFEWMDTAGNGSGGSGRDGEAGWLGPESDAEVTALLAQASPSAWAVPGLTGIRRWAGIRDAAGTLAAVAADAWSTPRVGFVAGVATAPALRGRGLGEAVCRFVLGALAAEHERVALMVDTDNQSAIRLYERLGMRIRPVAAAALTSP